VLVDRLDELRVVLLGKELLYLVDEVEPVDLCLADDRELPQENVFALDQEVEVLLSGLEGFVSPAVQIEFDAVHQLALAGGELQLLVQGAAGQDSI